ncbi:MAG: AAA family ATPase [Bacteroidota bacterium]
MNKKAIFTRLLLDFFERKFPAIKAREIALPIEVNKVIALVGPRRSGKTSILLKLVKELRQKVKKEQVIYFNFEDDRIYPLELADIWKKLSCYSRFPSGTVPYALAR